MERLGTTQGGKVGFKNASSEEIGLFVENTLQALSTSNSRRLDLFKFYSRFSQEIPHFISSETNRRIATAAKSNDPETSKRAANLLTLLNLKTILSVVRRHLGGDTDRNNDLVHYALVEVAGKAKELNENLPIPRQIHVLMTNKVLPGFIAEESKDGFGQELEEETIDDILARKELSEAIKSALEKLNYRSRLVIQMREFDEMTLERIGDKLGVTKERIRGIESDAYRNLRRYCFNSTLLRGIWFSL